VARQESSKTKARPGSASTDPRRDDYEPSEDERSAVKHWLARVARAERDNEAFFRELQTMRQYAAGVRVTEAGAKYERTNLVFATIATIVPQIYAKNPEVSVSPSKGCPPDRLKMVKGFCQTAEQFLNEVVIDEAKLKKRAKANVRSTLITSFGVLKMTLQESLNGDPIQVRRIQDAQDNIAQIEALAKDLKSEYDPQQLAVKRDELRAQLKGLMSSNEIKMYKGFALDRVKSENFLILDPSVNEFDEYEESKALGDKIFMTVREYSARFGHYPEKATKYNTPWSDEKTKEGAPQPAAQPLENMSSDDQYVCVIEIWDRESGTIRTVAKGMERWTRDAMTPKYASERWYPYFVLGFNLLEGRWRPISEPELLMGLQDEYTKTRDNFADARKDAVPRRVFRKGGNLSDNDIDALVNSMNRDWIGVEGNPAVPINQDVMQLDAPKIDPNAYDVTLIRNDIDMMAGISDASRANLIKPKTATEAELMAQSMGSRSEERRDVNEDLMSDMFTSALETGLRCFTLEEVKQMCGQNAIWPDGEESVEEIFSMVDVKIRAGSSGKPNSLKDKEQWLQLLPIIKETIEGVTEARATGNIDMANTAIELLRETVRRFEERIDVDMLIPPVDEDSPGQQMQAAMQQIQQLQAQLQQGAEQMQALTAERDKAVSGDQERAVKAQGALEEKARADQMATEQMARDEAAANAKAQADADAARRADELARYKIDREAETKIQLAQINAKATEEQQLEKERETAERESDKSASRELRDLQRALTEQQQNVLAQLGAVLEKLGESMERMAQSNAAPRRIEVELDKDGLPIGGTSRVLQ